MKTYHHLIITLAACCAMSCTSDKAASIDADFPRETPIAAIDSISLLDKGILLPVSVESFDSCFVLGNIRSDKLLSVLDKQSMLVRNVVSQGNGPHEIVHFIPVASNSKHFIFADRAKNKVFELSMQHDYAHTEVFQFSDTINRFFSLAQVGSNSYIGTGMFTQGRFLIFNGNKDQAYYEQEYPTNSDINPLDSIRKAAVYAGTLIAAHPNKHKFVAAYKGLIDFYNITDDIHLQHTKSKYYHFPLFGLPEHGPIVATKKESITGFVGLSYNEENIYLLYSNSSFLTKGADTHSGNTILVYDWDGNPVKKYSLDNELRAIDIDGDRLWGISLAHNTLYKYKL